MNLKFQSAFNSKNKTVSLQWDQNEKPVVTKDIIHRDYCPCCQKRVEPKLPDVLPGCMLGNRTLVFSALLHFLQGLTLSQIVDTFNFHLRMKTFLNATTNVSH